LDKEIALLEQKLKGVGQKIEKTKSEETILEFYDKSYLRLRNAYFEAGKKFERFYDSVVTSETNRNLFTHINREALFNSIREKGISSLTHFNINQKFVFFKYKSTSEFNFRSTISVELNASNYSIVISHHFFERVSIVTKPYSEQLTDEEINLIVNTEMKRHTAFIEDKIKEIQAP
jgi:hypothetical protein